uniref:DRBM domain-containing protein n=1 Tax=Timema shepardi TaxID=629360 RepID=A0A7R9ASV0_TIMSH|nr:unnamed protein product [Timema shepardi]
MAIIKHLLPLIDKSSHESGEYQSLEERFAVENTPKLFDPGQRTKSFLTYRMKIQRDRTLIELVLRRTLIDLKKDKTFHSLKESIEANHRKNKEEVQLLDKESKFKKNVLDLNHSLIAGQNQGNKKANSCLEKIAHLKDLFHDTMLQGRMEMYYIKQWEKSRQEQNEMRSNKNEQELTARSQRLAKLKQSEQRANAEVMAYLQSANLNLELKINEWINFYERSIEEKDESLLILTIEKERNMIRKNELQKLYDEHKEEINKYLKHRELKRHEIERKAFINSMATRLQTWWRGIIKMSSNAVGCLQEFCMKYNFNFPTYLVTNESGSPHAKIFTVTCQVGDHVTTEKLRFTFLPIVKLASLRRCQVKTANVEEWGDYDLRSHIQRSTRPKMYVNNKQCWPTVQSPKSTNTGLPPVED